jgi:GDPmannose 4,6-dehydratase
MKRSVIVGCLGQDGRLLYEYLIEKKYQIIGIDVNHLETSYNYSEQPVDITNKEHVRRLIRTSMPTEIYFLAALHYSSEDNSLNNNEELFQKSFEINTFSLIYFLEAILEYSPRTRLFYASSSHIFGDSYRSIDDENSNINPYSIYGITKAAGLFVCRYYRKEYSLFASCGILYNHESPFRTDNFISKKIIKAVIKIKEKQQDKIVLGDMNAEVDWGYAPDYVDAMHKILMLEYPDDFIVATGEKHKVSEFVEIAFNYLGLDWCLYIEENIDILQRKTNCRVGNPKKLMSKTGWRPSIDFKEMIKVLLTAEGAFMEK